MIRTVSQAATAVRTVAEPVVPIYAFMHVHRFLAISRHPDAYAEIFSSRRRHSRRLPPPLHNRSNQDIANT